MFDASSMGMVVELPRCSHKCLISIRIALDRLREHQIALRKSLSRPAGRCTYNEFMAAELIILLRNYNSSLRPPSTYPSKERDLI